MKWTPIPDELIRDLANPRKRMDAIAQICILRDINKGGAKPHRYYASLLDIETSKPIAL